MKTKVLLIKYNQNKERMLTEAIIQASKLVGKHKTIWLVWEDSSNIRGYYYHDKDPLLSRDAIDTLLQGKRLDFETFYLASISIKEVSKINAGDTVINCFTRYFDVKEYGNTSLLIHLPWSKYEGDMLENYEK